MNLTKPQKLKTGDLVAAVSLSSGMAGDQDIIWRYEQGKKRLQEVFALRVTEMSHTLSGSDFVYRHPEERAADLMEAFQNPEIKGIFSCIGGNDSIRMLPYLDFDVIRKNPKIFIGYSDSTITHYICMKAGITSFYGASILAEFAENIQMFDYTKKWINKALFQTEPMGDIPSAGYWTSEYLPWEIENKNTARKTEVNSGYELLQGSGRVKGRLIGGCLDVIEMIKGTEIFPPLHYFQDSILFLETSEVMVPPCQLEDWLRWYATARILQNVSGVIFAKPYDNKYYDEYKEVILKITAECGCGHLPVLYNVNFGHTAPICCIPYGVMAEICCEDVSFSILESGVV